MEQMKTLTQQVTVPAIQKPGNPQYRQGQFASVIACLIAKA